MKSQVTTRQGDRGMTRLLSGDVVPKHDPAVEAAGALDALRAQLARLRLMALERDPSRTREGEILWWLLNVCFLMGSELSDPLNRKPQWKRGFVGVGHLARLEREQARLEAEVQLPRVFIVSASNPVAAEADMAAVIARQFERRLTALAERYPESRLSELFPFVNRLSDFLFVLARHLDGGQWHTVDYDLAMEGAEAPPDASAEDLT
ncbi:MAG TPA: ATP:cob(I)alamin adenosyltransferase [Candidatus Hydrogenedentes bacterium]|nr:ATP:cob(I)alamin adenosyltransferase [Candidatus Hydrogenedentota bacterium]